ncbi:unnamed protein product [Schistosoma margrebowiei]|uniref:Uncharacterized protein n=1 Tax=Schistosoma margrebowiei TaxID=48269 RepID=A0A183MWK1_9TREM|nr:unnamed protein product [Schistosoma margrebowiei]
MIVLTRISCLSAGVSKARLHNVVKGIAYRFIVST